MPAAASEAEAFSAGGVVHRLRGGQIEVVLVGRTAQRLWALPKGTPEAGESAEQTACREVQEETGLAVAIVAALGSIFYRYPARDAAGRRVAGMVSKEVAHYLMRQTGGATELHDHEYDRVEWFTLDEAIGRVSYDNERTVLQRAQAVIDELPGPGGHHGASAESAAR